MASAVRETASKRLNRGVVGDHLSHVPCWTRAEWAGDVMLADYCGEAHVGSCLAVPWEGWWKSTGVMSVLKPSEDLCTNDREFILSALKDSNHRLDGRTRTKCRPVRITYARSEGQASAEVQLGKTRVLTVVTCEVVPPYPDRPTEGFLQLNVELSPMAAVGIDNSRYSPLVVEVDRIIERGIRESRALDTEALCIIAGVKAWAIRCDIRILDDGGNIIDAAALATVAALKHFRLPEVTVTGATTVMVHHSYEKEPSPLPLHHMPIAISFALFHEGKVAAIDPTDKEEAVMGGRITFVLNVHKELCALQKIGGMPLSPDNIMKWVSDATVEVERLHGELSYSLGQADDKWKEARLNRIRGTAAAAPSSHAPPPPATAPVLEEIARGAEQIKHLDFVELHVPVKVREQSEKKAPTEEEEVQKLQMLEKAAEDARRYHDDKAGAAATRAVEEAKALSAVDVLTPAPSLKAGQKTGVEKGSGEAARLRQGPMLSESRNGDTMDVDGGGFGNGGSDSDDEEEESSVLVSEFTSATATEPSSMKRPPKGGDLEQPRTKTAGRVRSLEVDDDDDDGPNDLRDIVRRPSKRKARGKKGGVKSPLSVNKKKK